MKLLKAIVLCTLFLAVATTTFAQKEMDRKPLKMESIESYKAPKKVKKAQKTEVKAAHKTRKNAQKMAAKTRKNALKEKVATRKTAAKARKKSTVQRRKAIEVAKY